MTENQPASQQEEVVIELPEVDHAAEFLQSQGVDASELIENVKKAAEKSGAKPVDGVVINDPDNPYIEKSAAAKDKPSDAKDDTQKDLTLDKAGDDDEFTDLINKTKKKSDKLKIESIDDLMSVVQKEFSIKDPATFVESARKFRTQAQKLKEVQENYDKLQAAFKEMPDDIFQALEKYYKGEDYKSVFLEQGNINFNKEFDEQNLEAVVKYYNPEIDTNDPVSDNYVDLSDKNSPQTKAIIQATKKQYEIDRKAISAKRSELEEKQLKFKQSFDSSAAASVEQLKSLFPNIKKQRIDAVLKILTNDEFDTLLYNEDRTVKPDAAERIYYAMNGKDVVQRLLKTIEELNETIDATINKNGSGYNIKGRGADPSGSPHTESEKLVSSYMSGNNGNPYIIKNKK